jgi:hypothetical protein
MSTQTLNQTFHRQNKTLLPATFKRAFVAAVHPNNNSADVYFAESPNTVIRNVPVSSAITIANLKVGMRCRVDLFDEKNSLDMVVAYYY